MPLHLIPHDLRLDFIGRRKLAYLLSGLVILLGLISLAVKGGPQYGIDFAGGVIVQVRFEKELPLHDVEQGVQTLGLSNVVVQQFGQAQDKEYLIRIPASDINAEELRGKMAEVFKSRFADAGATIQRLEMVGPKVGADLREKALNALLYSVLLIAIYISGRFEQRWMAAAMMAGALGLSVYFLGWLGMATGNLALAAMLLSVVICWRLKLNYAFGAVIAMIHDVAVPVGILSLLNREIDLTVVAALLTIVGYSLNDTIIIFDRIRENIRGKVGSSRAETVNMSINQTLSRTLITSGTTLITVACLYFLGGSVIHDFALVLLIGIIAGTYSSIFVASPILLSFDPHEVKS